MPIHFDEGRVPPRWGERNALQSGIPLVPTGDCIDLAFVNNMPDAALEDTEMQFLELLESAASDVPVRVRFYSLPKLGRGSRGQQHLNNFYFEFNDLFNRRFDAVIVTGTEPCSQNLEDEPYWPMLVQLLDWAERNTSSTILSCLAAHASVLHSDRIKRTRLSDKRFGVFDSAKVSDHFLMKEVPEVRFPHSRWNEIHASALTTAGYSILTQSVEAGVDTFSKTKGNSLFLHFQGHPEYFAKTLLKEYRRDIKRFLRGERDTYPSLPRGYFNSDATNLLMQFQQAATSERNEAVMSAFPEAAIAANLRNGWHDCALAIYRNWLAYIKSRKLEGSESVSLSAGSREMYSSQSAAD